MENRLNLANNGQQLTLDDINALGEVAALADDRVLAELMHLAPFNGTAPARGIIPAVLNGATQVGTTTGGVTVQPFRAVIGSRTTAASGAKVNWRDIRSAICIGSTTLAQTVAIAANASGNNRWDLVYAAVSVDVNANTVTRKIKNATTKVIAGASVTTQTATTVALGVVTGTPSASPVWPAIPADAGSTYYIPIAYIHVPTGYNSASLLTVGRIRVVANMLGTAPIEGGSMSIADINAYKNMSTAQQQAYTGGGLRATMPSIPQGTESLLLFIDATTAQPNVAINGGSTIVDASRDWSRRYFRITASAAGAFVGTNGLPNIGSTTSFTGASANTITGTIFSGVVIGSSFNTSAVIFRATPTSGGTFGSGTPLTPVQTTTADITITVDSSGRLVCTTTGQPNCQLLLWIEATSYFEF